MNSNFFKDNPENWKWGIFYVNKNDTRLIVPKRSEAFGWTLNSAQNSVKIGLAVIILSVIIAGAY